MNRKILLALFVITTVLISVSCVYASDIDDLNTTDNNSKLSVNENNNILSYESTSTFDDLYKTMQNSDNEIELTEDYSFDEQIDVNHKNGIKINKSNLVINGNNHIIDAKNQAGIFSIINKTNITLNNIVLKNGNNSALILLYGTKIITNNVTFINCSSGNLNGMHIGGAIISIDSEYISYNDKFIDNYAPTGTAIYSEESYITINNGLFKSNKTAPLGLIYAVINTYLSIYNSTFANTTSRYATAIYINNGNVYINNTKFHNLHANITAGAIGIKMGNLIIDNCEFINTSSDKNGGAIYADICGNAFENGEVIVNNTQFENCSSEFGGAILQLGGISKITNSNFTNNTAKYNGGATYFSYVHSLINSSNFNYNKVDIINNYPTYGGAIFNDKSDEELNIANSNFTNNDAYLGSALYIYDSKYKLNNLNFNNNQNYSIYSVYDNNTSEIGKLTGDYAISQLNTDYVYVMIGEGIKLTIINPANETVDLTNLTKYDLRELGWVSNVRNQGTMGSCWTFGVTGALESALIKVLNLTGDAREKIDFSENNMQNIMLIYSKYGNGIIEGGDYSSAIGYLLSWFGAFPGAYDTYDELGKISPALTTPNDIHIQDIIIIHNDLSSEGNSKIKEAIVKYGSLAAYILSKATSDEGAPTGYYNEETNAEYVNITTSGNHLISIVGWDDNYSKDNFLITPPGDGAWIVKNSWGSEWGDNGYMYVSYYDGTLSTNPDQCMVGIILGNTIQYNKNYQYDISGISKFIDDGRQVYYTNNFISIDDDMIAAVGTYFNQEGVNYTVQIKVNGNIVYTQKGKSRYYGYHTIKLDKYVSIKKDDSFSITITSNAVPVSESPRAHYQKGTSFIGKKDLSANNFVACIKVYTLPNEIKTENIREYYSDDTEFTIIVNESNAPVVVSIENENKTYKSDENGIVKVKLPELQPGTYIITTKYNNTTLVNTIEVLSTINSVDEITIGYKASSNVKATLYDANGNLLIYRTVTVKYDSKNMNFKTNEKGEIYVPLTGNIGSHTIIYKNPVTDEESSTTVKIVSRFSENKNINMYYYDGTYYKIKVYGDNGKAVGAKQAVTIKIDKKTYKVYTDSNGWAKLKIPNTSTPGKHTISATYKKQTIKNTLTVKQVLTTTKTVTVKKTAKKLVLTAKLANGKKSLKGKTISFKFYGKTYKVKTNSKGIAKVTVSKYVIKKIRAGKTYTATITYSKNTIKKAVKVRR
ncbi:Cysteine protease, C1A family [Methanobrevibacter gottschalkii]|uniref:Cysteine protease, C1A family n=1 Tax=Methanobrevibacter gottschalkii TaxID=190974 RepID=A0A1H7FAA0_9EURY|nr:C1 family peptidase [Methanobrevibacter gottschalkii]SEK23041.1 Cysteine protease, C1A family [Methanobrevibacter gottschalkii]